MLKIHCTAKSLVSDKSCTEQNLPIPEKFPLHIGLPEDPVVGVDHAGPEHAEEHDEGDELVDGPEHVPRDVGDALLDVVVKLSHHPVLPQGAASNQVSFNSVILQIKELLLYPESRSRVTTQH